MSNEQITGYVDCLLESWAVQDEGDELGVYRVMHDLLMAWAHYELMTDKERALVTALCKKMQHHFDTKCILKERKRKTTKEKFPLKPLLKEKEKKETREETPAPVRDAKEAFRQECLALTKEYDVQEVTKFYNHYTQQYDDGEMLFERERRKRGWNTKSRLKKWCNNAFALNDAAASERLKKARGKQQKACDEARSRQLAAEREEANARREREQEESKAGAVTREEWLAMKAKKTTDCTD